VAHLCSRKLSGVSQTSCNRFVKVFIVMGLCEVRLYDDLSNNLDVGMRETLLFNLVEGLELCKPLSSSRTVISTTALLLGCPVVNTSLRHKSMIN